MQHMRTHHAELAGDIVNLYPDLIPPKYAVNNITSDPANFRNVNPRIILAVAEMIEGPLNPFHPSVQPTIKFL